MLGGTGAGATMCDAGRGTGGASANASMTSRCADPRAGFAAPPSGSREGIG
jgi:hypothetical protein